MWKEILGFFEQTRMRRNAYTVFRPARDKGLGTPMVSRRASAAPQSRTAQVRRSSSEAVAARLSGQTASNHMGFSSLAISWLSS